MEYSEYNNLIQIYDRLVDVSDKLHAEHDFNVVGFDLALFTLHHALKSYVPVNLHVENRRLQRELNHLKDKRQEFESGKMSIVQKNNELIAENEKLRAEIARYKNIYLVKG